MLSSIDFWVVKNIVGRKLVKMRWWFIIDNDGNERWYYESKECNHLFQDKMVFWGTLYLTPAVWLLFSVMNAITFAIFKVKVPFSFLHRLQPQAFVCLSPSSNGGASKTARPPMSAR